MAYILDTNLIQIACDDGIVYYSKSSLAKITKYDFDKRPSWMKFTKEGFLRCLNGTPIDSVELAATLEFKIPCTWPLIRINQWEWFWTRDKQGFMIMVNNPEYKHSLKELPFKVLKECFSSDCCLLKVYQVYVLTRSKDLASQMLIRKTTSGDIKIQVTKILRNVAHELDTKEEISFIIDMVLPYL